MPNIRKSIEIVICIQIMIISAMIPVYFSLPIFNGDSQILEFPITWQIPLVILITLIFNGQVVGTAFTIYLLLGLFLIPVFYDGGSLGYLLTPNFGYLIGYYPIIIIIDNLKKKNRSIDIYSFLKSSFFGIALMHIVGIFYSVIQNLYLQQIDNLIYNISKYSLGKFGYHLLMLAPITLLINIINRINKFKNDN